MKKLALLFAGLFLLLGPALAAESLEYFKVYKPQEGMSAEEIMQIEYFVKYTLFAHDAQFGGKAYFVDKGGGTRVKETERIRVTLGRKSDGIAYKDLVIFTTPQVKGMGTLTWTYIESAKQPDSWIWIPSLKKIRKISTANGNDTFMGSDFTVEDILLRRFEDETYTLVGSEDFKGYACKYDKNTYYQGTPCFVIECRSKRPNWYYSKRKLWVEKATGAGIYEETYDPKANLYKDLFKKFQVFNVNGKDYPIQTIIEGTDFRNGHRTTILNTDVKLDQGLSEALFSERALTEAGRW